MDENKKEVNGIDNAKTNEEAFANSKPLIPQNEVNTEKDSISTNEESRNFDKDIAVPNENSNGEYEPVVPTNEDSFIPPVVNNLPSDEIIEVSIIHEEEPVQEFSLTPPLTELNGDNPPEHHEMEEDVQDDNVAPEIVETSEETSEEDTFVETEAEVTEPVTEVEKPERYVPDGTKVKKKSKLPIIIGAIVGIGLVVTVAYFGLNYLKDKNNTNDATPPSVTDPVVTPTPEPTPDPEPTPEPTPVEPVVEPAKEMQGVVVEIKEDFLIIEDETGTPEAYYIPTENNEAINTALVDIELGAQVKVTYITKDDEYVIESITLIAEPTPEPEVIPEETLKEATPEDLFGDFESELAIINGRGDRDAQSSQTPTTANGDKIETLTLDMTVEGSGTLWFRFAWKTNKETKVIPKVDEVTVELQNANGSLITPDNISNYGRYWVDNNVINYVIKNGQTGTWKFCVTKTASQKMGDISAKVDPLTGYIALSKADIKYKDNKLFAIWKVTGVSDENVLVTITAKQDDASVLVYSGNSVDDGIKLIDMVEISTSKLKKGTYDFDIKVQDIDTQKVNGINKISSKTIYDTLTITGVEVG